jgi:hypothetical protein
MLVLLAAPQARSYYPHVGLRQHDSCWIRDRTEKPAAEKTVPEKPVPVSLVGE